MPLWFVRWFAEKIHMLICEPEKIVKPSMYMVNTVRSAETRATSAACTAPFFFSAALVSPYHSRSPASLRATLSPGSPSRDLELFLDR